MTATACVPLVTSSEQRSQFIRTLQRDLAQQVIPEMELTLKVGVYSAAGFTRREIVERLGVQDMDVRMALARLKRIAEGW